MSSQNNSFRTLVRSFYDIQALRTMTGQRLVANFKSRLGQKPGVKEEDAELSDDAKKILADFRKAFERITDNARKFPDYKDFKGDDLISDYTELCLIKQYFVLLEEEDAHKKQVADVLQSFPIYTEFLEKIKGIGPIMGGVIIAEYDIKDYWKDPKFGWRVPEGTPGAVLHKLYPTSLWRYAGLVVMPDGAGKSQRKEHMEKAFYRDAKGKIKQKDSIGYNPWLKTKLCGVLGGSFLKAGVRWKPCTDQQYETSPDYKRDIREKKDRATGKMVDTKCLVEISSPYAKTYFDYRHRLENHPEYRDLTPAELERLKNEPQQEDTSDKDVDEILDITYDEETGEASKSKKPKANAASKNKGRKGHRHAMANRYMIKQFIVDLYKVWRKLEGQFVHPPYAEAKLGHAPHQDSAR